MIADREFIDLLAKGLAIEPRPFAGVAGRLGMSEEEVIARLQGLMEEGKVRRFAASVRHQPLGYAINAMVIARMEPDFLDQAGETASQIPAVSHCYQRPHPDGDPHCLYIMVHARDQESAERIYSELRRLPGLKSLEICPSRKELKKTSLSGVSSEFSAK